MLLLLSLLMLSAVFSSCLASGEELIMNGSFEMTDEYGDPEYWYTDAYIHDEGYSLFTVESGSDAPDGEHYVTIRNEDLNDARYVQMVEVEPETLYHVSFKVRADNVREGHGANVSVEGLYVFSEGIYETEGEWQTVDWYGETGEDQEYVTLYVRLGGYSGESAGKASFDAISMTKTDDLPGDTVADRWYRIDTGIDESKIIDGNNESEPKEFRVPLILICAAYSVFFIAILKSVRRRDETVPSGKKSSSPYFWFFILASLVIRVLLSARVDGYAVDVNCFLSWGNTMRQYGPFDFYQSTGFCDYPPAYTYILGLNSTVAGVLKQLFTGVSPETLDRIAFRFIPSLADLAVCILIRDRMAKQGYSERTRTAVGSMLAFFPVSILNSACWGQMDSVLCLLLLLVAMWATEHRWQTALPAYMLAVLVKPQALMLGFLGLAAMIIEWITRKESRREMIRGLIWSAVLLLAVVIPFTVRQEPFWLITQYSGTLASYPYATVNTANYFYLMGGNWSGIKNTATTPACMILSVFSAGYLLYLWKEQNKDGNRFLKLIEIIAAGCFTLWFAVCGILGTVSWNVFGWSAMAYGFIITLPPLIRSRNTGYLALCGGLLFILLYVFGIKMHERYLFPAFALLMYAWIMLKDDRILRVLLISGACVFLNEGIVLDNSIRLGSAMGHLNNDTVWLADIISVLNILNAVYAVGSFRKIMNGGQTVTISAKTWIEAPEKDVSGTLPKKHGLNLKKADLILMLTVSAVYAFVTFTTLGSTKAPQNAWVSSAVDEEIVIDLGAEYEDFTMLYFSRVSRSDFSVSVSYDGVFWSDSVKAQMNEGECYKWKYLCEYWTDENGQRRYVSTGNTSDARTLSGRYVRLTSDQIGLTLCEVLFRDCEQNLISGCRIISQNNAVADSPNYSDASALLDEQNTMEAIPDLFGMRGDSIPQPCWYNGTYFDEIYHARTAYEHIHGTIPYETSHPPLGKLIMSLGIMIFGMTPFGWRFAGALAGVLMIPAIYLLAKQLTGKTGYAAVAALLMALDCMHLTQTQIATIDSFPVLFIILSYFFMLRYVQTDIGSAEMLPTVRDLAFSGFFMGLGIASKWIGIYAGAGLAILYFWHSVRCILMNGDREARHSVFMKFVRLSIWCVLFFVVIPAVIYLLCYIPYYAYDKSIRDLPTFIGRVINSQTGMFNYHSQPGLGMDHPFYSPWYEWPVIKRPMYYASGSYIASETYDSSIFSFGNPAVWYMAIPCFLYGIWLFVRERHYRCGLSGNTCTGSWHAEPADHDPTLLFVTVGFLAQFLPWVLVPRGTYIYHYFASIPFLILFIVIALERIGQRWPGAVRILIPAYLVITLLFFIGYFPYASGILTPTGWLDAMKGLLNVYY